MTNYCNVPFICQNTNGNEQGLSLNALVYINNQEFSGISLSGLANFYQDLCGIAVSGIGNVVDGDLCGYSVGVIGNYANRSSGFAIQLGLFNKINEYDGNSTVLQLGLFNRIGNQTCPILNLRGFSKKSLEEEVKR